MTSLPGRVAVAVVGSGPVGLTLANLLGRYGVETLLIERNAATVQEPRAVSIDDESLRTLQAAGLADEVLQGVVPGYGSRYLSPAGRCFARVEPTGTPYGFPRRNAFRQPVLEATLHRGLDRFEAVHTRYGWRLVRFGQSADGVTLQLEGPGGALRQVACDYLVGCDGASSTVREQLGLNLAGTTFDERWLIVDLENHENRSTHTDVFCDRSRPGITLPGPDRTRRYEFKLLPGERDEELLQPAVVQRLLARHGADPKATLRRKVVYRFHARVAERWSDGRVFIAGDAAHLSPPFAGQGMNSGLRDAMNLAWKLAAVTAGRAGAALLASYEAERKAHAWEMIGLALRMGRVISPPSDLAGLATRLAFRALKLWPTAYDYLAQMKYKPKPRFRAGFVVAEDRPARGSLVGHLLPQPLLSTLEGQPALLDTFLGDRFVLMAPTADPVGTFAAFDQPVWRKLGAGRLAVLPSGARPALRDGIDSTVDRDGAFRALAGQVLLVRPDRYVAAAMTSGVAAEAAAAVDRLLDATWNDVRSPLF